MPQCYGIAVKSLHELLKKSNYIAVTTDVWTSKAHDSFLGITCHFIEDAEGSLSLISSALDCVPIHKNETAETLKTILNAVFTEWEIETKVKCIVTDNAKNMKKAVRLLNIRHLPCFAHSLTSL